MGEGELGGVPCSWHCCAWHSSSARIRGSWGLLWFLERPLTRGLSAAIGQLRRTLLSGLSLALPSLVPGVSGASSLFSGTSWRIETSQANVWGVTPPALQETCTFDPPCGLARGTSHTQPSCLQELQVQLLLLGFPECRETPALCAPPAQEAGGKPRRGPHEAPLTGRKVGTWDSQHGPPRKPSSQPECLSSPTRALRPCLGPRNLSVELGCSWNLLSLGLIQSSD